MRLKKVITILLCLVVGISQFSGCGRNKGGIEGTISTALPTPSDGQDVETGNITGPDKDQSAATSGQGFQVDIQPSYKLVLDTSQNIQAVEAAYEPRQYAAMVVPYRINKDLSNIENLSQFGEFTGEQKEMLSENGFLVAPSDEKQLFYVYESNEYLKVPSFITLDSVLQVYHIFFDYSLRSLEFNKLLPALEELNNSMLDKSIYIYDSIGNTEVKKQALRNIVYFGLVQRVLDKNIPDNIPKEARGLIKQEYDLVTAQKAFNMSPLLGFDLDYSQFKPRGHYTCNEELMRFFTAMMWYGQVPLSLYSRDEEGNVYEDKEHAVQALLMTYSLFLQEDGNASDYDLWFKIYDPTTFYAGKADDLTVTDFLDLLIKVYGKNPEMDSLMDRDKLELLFEEADKLPEPQIQPKYTSVNTPVSKQFRFMGQRYIPDSEILQKMVEPLQRPMPTGLDVMGVLGSDRAYELNNNFYNASDLWPEYPMAFQYMREKFSLVPEEKWRSNMYYGWLWTLKSLIVPFGEGYPSFMTNEAWEDKALNTALGSWSELRHDTILYGKQSAAEGGGDWQPSVFKSYVEPNVDAYDKLLWLTRYSRENLAGMEILPEDLENRMQSFEDLLEFLINCSVKELKNEELTEEEYRKLLIYGGTLEYLTSSLAEDGMRWFEITSETDKNMAVIADVHTVPNCYLEAGVGPASHIFVVVPVGNKLYLTRGAIFSYYEFVSNQRLTDGEWQKMIENNANPQQPDWTKSYQQGEKEEIPEPVEPFSSGY